MFELHRKVHSNLVTFTDIHRACLFAGHCLSKPIGTWDNPFTGTFNGNGYEIIGLTMTNPDAELVGLFGVARDNAQIYNITLRDCDITSAGRNAAKKSVGAIVAIAYGGHAYDNFVYPKE